MSESLPEIVMYARHTFCPDVNRARGRLTELGLDWTEFDVESDPVRRQEMIGLTGRGNVPTLVIGASLLVEPSNADLDRALAAAGYSVAVG